jgi:hypothetical protein
MRRTDRIAGFFLAGLAFLSQSEPTRAAFVIETASTGTIPISSNLTQPLALAKFDTTLGTLTAITISYVDNTIISGSVTNLAAAAESFTITQTTTFSLLQASNLLLTNSLEASQTYTNLAPSQTSAFGVFTPSGGAGPLVLTSGALFDSLSQSTGDIIFDFSTLMTTRVFGGGGNNTIVINPSGGATLTVRYDYTPTSPGPGSGSGSGGSDASAPEPASVVMTALGGLIVASAGLVRKRWVRDRA